MGYFTRDEIPFQFALADAFTICDGYHQSIMAPTSPNRMYLWTGTSSGFITNPDDYTVDFGPDAGTAEVTTYPDQLQQATSATTRSGSTSSSTPPTAATAGPARSRPTARSPHGRPTRGRRR
jgi:phospholipase C